MWWPSLITTSSTSKNVVNVVLVNWKQPESIKNVTKITEYPVWKISIYYTRHPPMLMHWTQRIGVPSSRRTASNSAHKNMPNLDQVHLRKIFCWPFFSCLENLVDLSLATFLIFSTFPFFGHFWQFWATFTSHMRWSSLVRREFCDPDAPSSAQAILRRTHPEILGAITLLHQTYLA